LNLQRLSLSLELPRLGEHQDWNTPSLLPHSPREYWQYDAKTTSARTCERCLEYERRYGVGSNYLPGSYIPLIFPWHTHVAVNQIHPNVHPHCRCNLWYVGRRKWAQ